MEGWEGDEGMGEGWRKGRGIKGCRDWRRWGDGGGMGMMGGRERGGEEGRNGMTEE